LYTNESNIGEEITRRLEALKNTAAMENESYYGTDKQYDLDAFEREGYEVVFEDENDEFSAEVDDV
jgi:hypothetical protein